MVFSGTYDREGNLLTQHFLVITDQFIVLDVLAHRHGGVVNGWITKKM